ncbi:hypothetical protein B566_EDAN001718 [Ephemera danica]|nr:hypothetical protein B566_EDAN001718 [Ephemera danica]
MEGIRKMPSPFPTIIAVDQLRCNLSNLDLAYDEACLLVTSESQSLVTVFAQNTECLECDLLEWASVKPGTTVPLLIKSRHPLLVQFQSSSQQTLCSWEKQFGEHGVFELNVNNTSCGNLITLQEPASALMPLLVLLLVYAGLWLISAGLNQIFSSNWYKQLTYRASPTAELENDLGSPSGSEGPPLMCSDTQQALRKQRSRVKSLDTFRGLCITLMIFVNYGGGKYLFFEHSTWNGLTVADVVFPSFMWIMGVSMVLSMRSQLRSGLTRHQLARRVVLRGLKLVAIGAVLNSMHGRNNIATYRIAGVLQRLGICYIFVSYLGPGGLHNHSKFANCTGGAAGYVDHMLLGPTHLYSTPTCKKVYHTTVSYDPEGLLGQLTGILLVQLGVQAGRVLLTYSGPCSRISRWLLWGLFTGITGGLLCSFSKEGGLIPVNKNLFSLSFVLVNASIDFFILVVLYLLVDVKRCWSGAPFYITGMNSLLLYVGHVLTNNLLPWKWQPLGNSHAELLAMDAWATTLWVFIAYQLFRNNFFLTV